MADYKQVAVGVLEAVGGKDNVIQVTHCMTRLRFNLKDTSLASEEKVTKVTGVIGVVQSGGQFQVIIGQTVNKVYDEVCKIGGFAQEEAINENLDGPKGKLTLKGVGNNILNYLAGSLTPLIPVIIAAAMFKTVMVVLGPDMLKLISAKSDLYVLLDFLYDAGFYFLPVYLGYTAARKLGVTPVMGMFMGAVLISPDFVAIATAGTPFTVYGIPCYVNNYSQSVLPIILSIWVMSYVEKFFKKHMPSTLTTIFTPFLTMVIMVPVSLCLLAPAGAFLGKYIGAGLNAFGDVGGFVAIAVIAALWEFIVMSGMHMVLIVTAITMLMSSGSEDCILVAGGCATWAAFGMALGAFLRLRNKEEKSLSMGYFISGIIGGVTEPVLYGIGFKYKRPFIALMIGAAVGGAYAGITHVSVYVMGATNFLALLGYVGGGTTNLVNGTIAALLSLSVAAAATYFIGFKKEEPAIQK